MHHLGQGMHYGLLEIHAPVLPNYVVRVNYKGKDMTERARDQRRIDPRGLLRIQYDHFFHTMFHLDYYTSMILARNPMVAKSQWYNVDYDAFAAFLSFLEEDLQRHRIHIEQVLLLSSLPTCTHQEVREEKLGR